MSRLIKIIDENTIEIAEYRNPEVIFKSSENPPTLQNIKDEIEHLEWYCTFKATINPFQLYAENDKLHTIIRQIEDIYTSLQFSAPENMYIFINELSEILQGSDKE